MSRGDRREEIYPSDVDRQDFIKTLAETCQKTGFQVHAYCLMPPWIRTDRLLGAHGIQDDTARGRQELESRMEARRLAESDEEEWKPLRRGWCLGSEEFKKEMLERAEGRLGEHHSGELKRESAEVKAEQIIREELERLGWTPGELPVRLKCYAAKLHIANRLRTETTLSVKWIAARLHMGTWKSATTRLHAWKKRNVTTKC